MRVVTIKRSVGTDGRMKVELDGKKIPSGTRAVVKSVSEAQEHVLTWYVAGPPGTPYSIAITSPEAATFAYQDTLDESMKDVGHHWFRV